MTTRWWSYFSDLKVQPAPVAKKLRKGVMEPPVIPERTAAWPDVTPHEATSMNRKTGAKIVKQNPKKAGID